MAVHRLSGSVLMGVLLAAGAPSSALEEPPRFPGGVERVRLDVVVVDDQGHPVVGLTATDFVIEENGRPRRIESFEPVVVRVAGSVAATPPTPTLAATPLTFDPEQGRCLLIVIDDVHLASSTAQQLRLHLVPFVERELREGDWVTVVAPHAHVWWTARTAWERAQLPAILGRIGGQYSRDPFHMKERGAFISDFDAMEAAERQPSGPHGGSLQTLNDIGRSVLPEEVYAAARQRIAITLRELRQAVTALVGFRGHKSLVLYSQGFILAPRFPEFDAIIEEARRGNVAVHFLDPVGLQSIIELGTTTRWVLGAAGAISIAEATGGRNMPANDPVLEVRRILEESQAYYLIGYPPVEGGPRERRVRVRVLRDGLKVLARTRYVVLRPSELKLTPQAEALRSVADATDLPIRAEVRLPASDASTGSRPAAKAAGPGGPLPILVDLAGEAGASKPRRLSLLIEARPRDKGDPVLDQAEVTVSTPDRPARFERTLQLAPGVWQARVVVRDLASGRLGSVLLTFEVPATP